MHTTVTLSQEQAAASATCVSFLTKSHTHRPYLTMGGLAGTGKTTIIKHILNKASGAEIECPICHGSGSINPGTNYEKKCTVCGGSGISSEFPIAVCALAGKAVHVLRKKGIRAATIHSTIYDAEENEDGTYTFTLKKSLPFAAYIIDEASMISRELLDALLTYKKPILFVGDHGQLEPIGDNPNLMQRPDLRLEKIHRQAADSPILTLAHHVRNGRTPIYSSTNSLCTVKPISAFPEDLAADPTFQVICAFNDLRHALNADIRLALHPSLTSPADPPVISEKIICLANNRALGIFNGMMGTIRDIRSITRHFITIDFETDDGTVIPNLPCFLRQFGSSTKDLRLEARNLGVKTPCFFDYAYCITGHKSQGSEWDKVAVIDQPSDLWSSSRWRYTTATRASQALHFYTDFGADE